MAFKGALIALLRAPLQLVPSCRRRQASSRTALSICPELVSCPLAGTSEARAWLWSHIDVARTEMMGDKRPEEVELYKRRWAPVRSGKRFVVMQFNLLAEGLCSSPDEQPPFPHVKPSDWGGFTDVPGREVCLIWRLRRWRVLEEILRQDPDVLAVEELDHYADFLEPAMKAAGYDGHWLPKGSSPCLDFGYYPDGVAIFWKTAAFEKVSAVRERNFNSADGSPSNQVYLTVDLRHHTGEEVRFAATHLKAKEGEKNEQLRGLHAVQLLKGVSESPAPRHIVICGDFNTDPFDIPGVQKAVAVPAVVRWSALGFASAYQLPENASKGEYTTWKRRGTKESRHVIDYIFHSPSLRPGALLEIPAPEDVDIARLPGFRYPSDHMAIAAELEFTSDSCL